MKYKISQLNQEVLWKLNGNIIVFDVETTGLSPRDCHIIEFAGTRLELGMPVEEYQTLINPDYPLPKKITEITGITDGMLSTAPKEHEVVRDIFNFVRKADILVGHNVNFDLSFLDALFARYNGEIDYMSLDTLALARKMYPNISHKLGDLADYFQLERGTAHRAAGDVETTISLLRHICKDFCVGLNK